MYAPIAFIAPQYENYANWWLKGYLQGTATPLSMATDATGLTLLEKAEIDAQGFITTDGTARFIPHFNAAYDLLLFPTEIEARKNITANAIELADNINPSAILTDASVFTDELIKVSANDTTAGYLNGKLTAGDNITLTEGSDGGDETLAIAYVATPQAVVAGHIRAGNTQYLDLTTASAGIELMSGLGFTEGVFESIGPTGSGADNIWTEMDVLPPEATILLCHVLLQSDANTANNCILELCVANGDDATPSVGANITNAVGLGAVATTVGELTLLDIDIMIPLGPTNQDFKATFVEFNNDLAGSAVVQIYYRGFMTD